MIVGVYVAFSSKGVIPVRTPHDTADMHRVKAVCAKSRLIRTSEFRLAEIARVLRKQGADEPEIAVFTAKLQAGKLNELSLDSQTKRVRDIVAVYLRTWERNT